MNRALRVFIVCLSGLVLANCATVTRGLTSQVQITSEPSGADVRTSLSHACTTPCTLQIDRKAEFTVNYSKPGYRDATASVATRIAGAGAAGFAGNILIGGIVGMGVDAATGSTLEHFPNPVHMKLDPVGPPPKSQRGKSSRAKPAPVAKPVEEEPPAPPAEEPAPAAPAS